MAAARSGLLRRLPVLAVVAVGVLLWRAPFFPQERTLVYQLPDRFSAATHVDLQLYDDDGALLSREQRYFSPANGAPRELSQKITLRAGRYRAQVFARLPGEAAIASATAELDVRREPTLVAAIQ